MDLVPVPWIHHSVESRPHAYVIVGISNQLRGWLYERTQRYRLVLIEDPDETRYQGNQRIFIELEPDLAFEFAMWWR